MDNGVVITKISEWMLNRGWKKKIAKHRQYDQSLFEHTLVELDMLLNILPIIHQSLHFDLTEEEESILITSVIAHDVGKERPEWQEYVLGRGKFLSDIDPELTKRVLPELCMILSFPDLGKNIMAVIENCVDLHMSHERKDTNVVMAILKGTGRWYTLANLVYQIDNICSAKGVFEAKISLERSLLGKHLKTTYHQVVIRGVSTTALHKAALERFQAAGWTPLLHFSDATLYVCSAAQPMPEPTPAEIENRLIDVLKEATGKDVTRFIVGSPTGSILPKPDLFDHSEIQAYLEAATRKIGRKSFMTRYEREKNRALSRRTAASGGGKSKAEVIEDYWKAKGNTNNRYSPEMNKEADRISTAHPDMVAFKFFKATMKQEFIGDGGIGIAQQEYEATFGSGSWAALISTSTLMPAQDMAKTVDLFWQLPGQRFQIGIGTVEELASEKRTELLVKTLSGIASKVYAAIPNPPSRATLAREMAASFIQDLVSPTEQFDLTELARQQMTFYAASKPFAGKQTRNAKHICPICNTLFEGGTKAAADFIAKPESHTNRGVAYCQFDHIIICNTCKYERFLRQLLLGERAEELIVIFPRMNIGPGTGELLVRKTRELFDRAYILLTGDTDDPDRRLGLAFTHYIAGKVLDQDIFRLTPQQLADLLTYRSGEGTRKENWHQLKKDLKAVYEDNLGEANTEWGADFTSWDEATGAVYENKVNDPTARRIRAEVCKLLPHMQLVCQTPHMIMLPVSYPIRYKDDSETNAALRRTFIALLLGLSLDATVAVVHDFEQIDFQGGEGVAFVPSVAAVRELIGSNWVSLSEAERWFLCIGVASILSNLGQYSERSGLFEVLLAPTPGHVLRRIEQKRAMDKTPLNHQDIVYLRFFESVRLP